MAALDVDAIVVGANGKVWTAPVGTAAPADEATAPGAGWVDLGGTNEDGATFRDGKTLEVIRLWQLFNPARRIVTEHDTNVEFALRQWDKDGVPFAFGGGAVSTPSPGHYKYTPPAPETIDERSLMLDWADGTNLFRLVIARGMVTSSIETNFRRNAAADLPVTFSVNGSEAGTDWYLLTNHPAFA